MLNSVVMKDNVGFLNCYKKGKFCACSYIVAYYICNGTQVNRIGISVSKKIGNAVKRNRAKRIIRAAYRLEEKNFPTGYDIVFVARKDIDGKKSDDISAFFSSRLYKAMNKSTKSCLNGGNNQ